jgi:class 3 adenylate cyclase
MGADPGFPNSATRPQHGEAGPGGTRPVASAQPQAPDQHDHASPTIGDRRQRLVSALAGLRHAAATDVAGAVPPIRIRVVRNLKGLRRSARLAGAGRPPRSDAHPPAALTNPATPTETLTSRPRGPTERASRLVAILFTDVVASAGLLARVGDDDADLILEAFLGLLADTAAHHGGRVVKWLGDGLMVSFSSAAGALRCAITMQLASGQPVGEERLSIRVGVNAGEALCSETDFFGAAVVTAHRLCRAANAGQILSSDVVVGLVAGRPEFTFSAAERIDRQEPYPVAACELRYQPPPPPSSAQAPFVDAVVQLRRR